ncbi:glycosyltransferase [Shewanella algae]|uniref:glycosyltransferase n=1 Tax=Shewanella algae TaxID=38313 RepID=UPI001AADD347|nr:glycosyltransferase [Shewanella algae]MBO2674536.1 glycosyltransferase [Shewanella algae]
MKVAFFQPYLANWRIEFLDYFIQKTSFDVMVYDGGFGGKHDKKSTSGNSSSFDCKKLFSASLNLNYKKQPYPIFFSPALFFHLVKDRPDIVITEGEINFINNISIQFYCWLFSKKFVWWSLGKVRTRRKNIINKLFDPIIKFQIKGSSCVMARNTYAKSYYLENNLKKPDDIIVAPNSMNQHKATKEISHSILDELSSIKEDSQVILYVGALTKEKRSIDLLESFNLISKNRSDLKLWFVGEGEERHNLETFIISQGLQKSVTLFGKVFDGVGNYFTMADIVVVPGLGGLVINHAMIFGCPVVSRLADGTELDLVIDGETGFLVNDYSNVTLATYIEIALEKELNCKMSKGAKSLIENTWNIDIMYEQVNKCILHSK